MSSAPRSRAAAATGTAVSNAANITTERPNAVPFAGIGTTGFSIAGHSYVLNDQGGLVHDQPRLHRISTLPHVSLLEYAFDTGGRRRCRSYPLQLRGPSARQIRLSGSAKRTMTPCRAGVLGQLAKGLSNPGNAYTQARTDWGVAGNSIRSLPDHRGRRSAPTFWVSVSVSNRFRQAVLDTALLFSAGNRTDFFAKRDAMNGRAASVAEPPREANRATSPIIADNRTAQADPPHAAVSTYVKEAIGRRRRCRRPFRQSKVTTAFHYFGITYAFGIRR